MVKFSLYAILPQIRSYVKASHGLQSLQKFREKSDVICDVIIAFFCFNTFHRKRVKLPDGEYLTYVF